MPARALFQTQCQDNFSKVFLILETFFPTTTPRPTILVKAPPQIHLSDAFLKIFSTLETFSPAIAAWSTTSARGLSQIQSLNAPLNVFLTLKIFSLSIPACSTMTARVLSQIQPLNAPFNVFWFQKHFLLLLQLGRQCRQEFRLKYNLKRFHLMFSWLQKKFPVTAAWLTMPARGPSQV